MPPIVIYDCEILRCIPPKPLGSGVHRLDDGLEYCGGWKDHANMGISVIGAYLQGVQGYQDGEIALIDTAIPIFGQMIKGAVVVGFNSRGFDDSLCQANGIQVQTHYDLLEEIRIAAGFQADYRSVTTGYNYKLGAIGEANGIAKTGTGDLAPVMWQQGKQQEVIDYCLNDIKVTKHLLLLGLKGGLVDPNTGNKLQLRSLKEVIGS